MIPRYLCLNNDLCVWAKGVCSPPSWAYFRGSILTPSAAALSCYLELDLENVISRIPSFAFSYFSLPDNV